MTTDIEELFERMGAWGIDTVFALSADTEVTCIEAKAAGCGHFVRVNAAEGKLTPCEICMGDVRENESEQCNVDRLKGEDPNG